MPGTFAYWGVVAALALAWWFAPQRHRFGVLAALSAAWLATLAPLAVAGVVAWSLAVWWLAGAALPLGRWGVRAAIAGLFLQLALFKYVPIWQGTAHTAADLALPLGISYSTFKLVHYALDRSRGALPHAPLPQFLAWMLAFPIFTAGPIERFDHFRRSAPERPSRDALATGVTRLVHGSIKKFLLADVLILQLFPALPAHTVVSDLASVTVGQAWWFLLAAFLYNYLDFAGYSDLAVGGCKLLGIDVVENFDSPLLARDLGDFWKRWHRSLANWCQAYVYLPVIGYTRQPFLAVFATFAAMGLWHLGTWNWLCWGLWHATGVATALAWTRFKRVRGWRWTSFAAGLPGRALTLAWATGGYAFTTIQGEGGVWDAVRLLARLFGGHVGSHPW